MDGLCLCVLISCMFSATNNFPKLASVFSGSCAFFLVAKLLGMIRVLLFYPLFMASVPNFEYLLNKSITPELFICIDGFERQLMRMCFGLKY